MTPAGDSPESTTVNSTIRAISAHLPALSCSTFHSLGDLLRTGYCGAGTRGCKSRAAPVQMCVYRGGFLVSFPELSTRAVSTMLPAKPSARRRRRNRFRRCFARAAPALSVPPAARRGCGCTGEGDTDGDWCGCKAMMRRWIKTVDPRSTLEIKQGVRALISTSAVLSGRALPLRLLLLPKLRA